MDDWTPQLDPTPDNRQFKWYYHTPTSTLHMEDISGNNYKTHSTMWGEQNGLGDTPWHNLKTGYAEVWHNKLGDPAIDHRWYNKDVPEHVHQLAMNALAQHLQNTPWEAAGASLTAAQGKPEVASPYRLNPLNNDSPRVASEFYQHDMDANEWMPERQTNEFWEQRRPWMSFEDGHIWIGAPGEHHDSEPNYPAKQTDMGELTPTGEAYSYGLRNRRQRQPHIEEAFQKIAGDWVSDSADSWTGPQSVDKFHVDVPGNADGMGGIGYELEQGQFRQPCYCDVGPTDPHEWGPTCENGLHPTMLHEASPWTPNPDHWVWLDGQVAFGGEHADIAMKLAQEQGLDHDAQRYVSNLIARGQQPYGHNVAVGTLQGGYPHIWMSTIDRNAVWDDVARATMQKTANDTRKDYHWRDHEHPYHSADYTDDDWQFGDRTPYIYFPDSDEVYYGNPGMYHDTVKDWAITHRGDANGIYGVVYKNPDNPNEHFQDVHKYQWNNDWADYDPHTGRATLPDDKKALLAERIGVPFHETKQPEPDLTNSQLDEFWKPVTQ